jgi:hypothetical protein
MALMPSVAIRWTVSLLLCFHLVGVILSPNPNSFGYLSLEAIYKPYLSSLGLGYTWGFFAPEPVAPPLYIDYVLEGDFDSPIRGRFPEEGSPYFFRDRQNRRMTLSKFILSSDANIRTMMVAYLCRNYPGTKTVKLWRALAKQPSLAQVRAGEKRMTDAVDYHIEVIGSFFCGPEDLPAGGSQ